MTEDQFWAVLAKMDWDEEGDDEAVMEPAVKKLASMSVEAIQGFEDILAQKLYALDTEAHARRIGEYAYGIPGKHFSVDWFLYVRCYVVANGRETFEQVLADPKQMPEDMEFESLLSLAGEAYELKTGEEFDYVPKVSYETFSNEAGWANALPDEAE